MLVVVVNSSRKKSFRRSKRIVSAVLPSVTIRVNLGHLPKRVLLQLIENLKQSATRGTNVKLFFEDKTGFFGLKCVEIGPRSVAMEPFVLAASGLDEELAVNEWLVTTLVPTAKEKAVKKQALTESRENKGVPPEKQITP